MFFVLFQQIAYIKKTMYTNYKLKFGDYRATQFQQNILKR